MQSNIYAQKENGDLRLLAEIEGETDPALAVDALLDEMPRLKQRSFVVIDLDNVMVVEAEDEIVQPRRKITVSSNGQGQAMVEPEDAEEDDEDEAEDDDEQEVEVEQPKPKPAARRGRSRGATKQADKPASKRRRSRSTNKSASGKKGSPFKANPASAE
jgi:hypothetical protein